MPTKSPTTIGRWATSVLTTFAYGLACLGISYYAELGERIPDSKD